MPDRIVVVDDDLLSSKIVRIMLQDEGYEVVCVKRGNQAFAEILGRDTQLVIIDVTLPDIDGFTLLKELRARGSTCPSIFLTGRSATEDKLEAFRIGADDYIVKPFEPLELVARVASVIRRFHFGDRQSLGTILRVGDAELSIGELSYSSDIVDNAILSPTEMRILELLMRNARIIISRERIIERVWGFDMEGSTNRVDVYIRRVRRKIERDPTDPKYLHTIRGIGYVFRPEEPAAPLLDPAAAFVVAPN